MAILEENITIQGSKPLPAFLARPEGEGPHPGVLIIFEIFGLNDHMRSVARRFAEAGYAALAPDFFRHEPVPYTDFQGARAVAAGLSDEQAMVDVGAALDYLTGKEFANSDRLGVVGFCMGGRLAFLAACHHPGRLRACVDFYGGRMSGGKVHDGQTMVPLDHTPSLEAPVLLFFGADDQSILPEEIDAIRTRLTEAGKTFESHVYPGADHGFFCDQRSLYNAGAASDAWLRTLAFLKQNLSGPQP